MKHVRLELHVTVIVHAGEDVSTETTPERDPNTVEVVRISRVIPVGGMVHAHDVAANHFPSMLANVGPGMAERLRRDLKLKGH